MVGDPSGPLASTETVYAVSGRRRCVEAHPRLPSFVPATLPPEASVTVTEVSVPLFAATVTYFDGSTAEAWSAGVMATSAGVVDGGGVSLGPAWWAGGGGGGTDGRGARACAAARGREHGTQHRHRRGSCPP